MDRIIQCSLFMLLALVVMLPFEHSKEIMAAPVENPLGTEYVKEMELNDKIDKLQKIGKYEELPKYYKELLSLSESNSSTYVVYLLRFADMYYNQREYGEAEPLYKRALSMGSSDPKLKQYIRISLAKLAELYKALGQYGKAELFYRNTLNEQEKALGSDHPEVARTLTNMAELYVSIGQYFQVEALIERSSKIIENVFGTDTVEMLKNLQLLGIAYNHLGKYSEGEMAYQRAIEIGQEHYGANSSEVTAIVNNLGIIYAHLKQYARAEALYKHVIEIFDKSGHSAEYAVSGIMAMSNLTDLYREQERYNEAEQIGQRAFKLSNSIPDNNVDKSIVLNNLGLVYDAREQYVDAIFFYELAFQYIERRYGSNHPNLAGLLNNIASCYQQQRKYDEAMAMYERSLSITEKGLGSEHPDVANTLNNIAILYSYENQVEKGMDTIRKATRIYRNRILVYDSLLSTIGVEGERKRARSVFGIELKVAGLLSVKDASRYEELVDETFDIGQLFHDGPVGDALAKMAARFSSGSGALAGLARERDDAINLLKAMNDDLLNSFGTSSMAERIDKELFNKQKELKEKIRLLNERLTGEFPAYAELTIPTPVPLKQAMELLAPDEALLVYVLDPEKCFVWLVMQKSARFRMIDKTSKEIRSQVETLRKTLSPDDNPKLSIPFPVNEAHSLFKDLMGPEANELINGIKTLFIVPDGALESLPFSILVTEKPGQSSTDYQKVAWVSRKWAPVTLPTVSSLRALRTLAVKGDSAQKSFVGFGNPDFKGTESRGYRGPAGIDLARGTLADTEQLRTVLRPLPDTEIELRAVAQIFGGGVDSLFLGAKASVPTVMAGRLDKYRVVHFATHALVAGEVEKFQLGNVEPAIALTPPLKATAENDGLLRASQVAQLRLNADWVVLSACNTAAPDGTPGAVGLSGLAKAFFYAGARAMLVSHWSVVSESTVVLITEMFKEWQAHPELGRAESLRRAQMALLDHPVKPFFTHPMAWAPFVVAGEGGMGR